jgi:alkyl hydroperoxide reductase subunit AhpC
LPRPELGAHLRYPDSNPGKADQDFPQSFGDRGSDGFVPRKETPMTLQLGDVAPDFEADTTEGRIKFHDWIGDSWAVLFSHPKDFTPVCTTELGYMAKIKPDFDARGVKIIGLSVDKLDNHEQWAKDIEETQGVAPNYPIISDNDFNVSKLYGMLAGDTSGDVAGRTPADNQTVRNVFVIGPDKKVKLILVYPMTTGRNFDEVLRVVDSLQLTANHKVATPANWKPGEKVIIAGSVSNDQAKEAYPDGWEEPRPYIRLVPQPN